MKIKLTSTFEIDNDLNKNLFDEKDDLSIIGYLYNCVQMFLEDYDNSNEYYIEDMMEHVGGAVYDDKRVYIYTKFDIDGEELKIAELNADYRFTLEQLDILIEYVKYYIMVYFTHKTISNLKHAVIEKE